MAGLSAGTVEAMDGRVVGRNSRSNGWQRRRQENSRGNRWQRLTAPEEDHEGVDDDQSKGRWKWGRQQHGSVRNLFRLPPKPR